MSGQANEISTEMRFMTSRGNNNDPFSLRRKQEDIIQVTLQLRIKLML